MGPHLALLCVCSDPRPRWRAGSGPSRQGHTFLRTVAWVGGPQRTPAPPRPCVAAGTWATPSLTPAASLYRECRCLEAGGPLRSACAVTSMRTRVAGVSTPAQVRAPGAQTRLPPRPGSSPRLAGGRCISLRVCSDSIRVLIFLPFHSFRISFLIFFLLKL